VERGSRGKEKAAKKERKAGVQRKGNGRKRCRTFTLSLSSSRKVTGGKKGGKNEVATFEFPPHRYSDEGGKMGSKARTLEKGREDRSPFLFW